MWVNVKCPYCGNVHEVAITDHRKHTINRWCKACGYMFGVEAKAVYKVMRYDAQAVITAEIRRAKPLPLPAWCDPILADSDLDNKKVDEAYNKMWDEED